MVSAEAEWADYEAAICRVLEVERLEPVPPTTLPMPGAHLSPPPVAFHNAEMNCLPYLVARVGSIFGSPAPVFLTWGHEQASALARLGDVCRIGVRGQAFRDFVEAGRKQGLAEAEIVTAWQACERAVMGNREPISAGRATK